MAVSPCEVPGSKLIPELSFDTRVTYVRVTGRRPDGFVEFDFAIGEPEIFVELILPPAAFAEFCEANAVHVLKPASATAPSVTSDADEPTDPWAWRLTDATGFRS